MTLAEPLSEASPPGRHPILPPMLITRAAHVVLWTLVAGAAAAGTAALASRPPQSAEQAVEVPPDPTRARAFAEAFVWAYLGRAGDGDEAVLEPFLADAPDLTAVTPGGQLVLETAVLDSEEIEPGYWSVTIAADVLTAAGGAYQPAGVRYYTVGVVETGGALAATGPPSLVAAPQGTEPPPLAVTALGLPEPGAELDAALGFLRAYLAGDGDLDRYTSPDLQLEPVSPPPYTGLDVQRAGMERDGAGAVLLRLEVAAEDGAGLTNVLGYSLEVAERSGRWEVSEIHGAAPLAPRPPS